MPDTALIIDDETRRVLVQALDLLQRVAMGRWHAASIRRAHREAQVACDLWHALGGGMELRQGDRLTNARMSVAEVRE